MRMKRSIVVGLIFALCSSAALAAASSAGIARGIVNSVTSCGTGCTEVEVQDLSFSPPFYIDRIRFVDGLQVSGDAILCGMSVTVSYLPRIYGGAGSGSDLYYLQAVPDKLSANCPIGQICGCPTL